MQGAKLVGTALEQSKNYLQSSGVDHAGSSSDPTHILKFSHNKVTLMQIRYILCKSVRNFIFGLNVFSALDTLQTTHCSPRGSLCRPLTLAAIYDMILLHFASLIRQVIIILLHE